MKNLRIKISSEFDLIDYAVYRDYTDDEAKNLPQQEVESGRMVAMFQDEEVAKAFIQAFENRPYNNSRPSKTHSFIEENWVVDEDSYSIYDALSTKTICQFFDADGDTEPDFFENRFDNAKAISQVPKLVQIAEMYFDTLVSAGKQGGFPYKVTLETLNNL